MKVYEILKELEATTKRNEKLAILEKNKNNQLLLEVVKYALDPFKQFYIKKIPDYEPCTKNYYMISLQSAIMRLNSLSDRVVTGHAAIAHLEKLLSSLNAEDSYVLECIIKKDLRCGVSVATVNAIWPGLIHEFPCMLCSPYSEKTLRNIDYPAIIQKKCDGMRVAFIYDAMTGKVDVRSRNGKFLELRGAFDNEVRNINFPGSFVIDGELLVLDSKGNIMSRKAGNGILNKANKGTISEEEAARVVCVAWDIIPMQSWLTGKYEVAYEDRFKALKKAVQNSEKFSPATSEIVLNYKQAVEFYQKMLADGEEGAIIKNTDSIWENKRSKDQVKLKIECEVDLVITGMVEGEKKYMGKLGALVCESSDGKLKVNVGSGFSDKQRAEFWGDENLIGKVVTVKSNDIIEANGRETKALFLPVFIEIRDDKDTADSMEKIEDEFRNIKGA